MIGAVDSDVTTVAFSARAHGMNGPAPGYAWINIWEDYQTEAPQLREGWLFVTSLSPSTGEQAFRQNVSDMSKSEFNITIDPDSVNIATSTALYDAIMLYAYAATEVMNEGRDLADGKVMATAIRNTTFEGVGGQIVALDNNGDRITSYEVLNFKLETEEVNAQRRKTNQLSRVLVGLYFNFNAIVCQDRMGTSEFGTKCAETRPYCEKTGINWKTPEMTNAAACPVTCGKCDATGTSPVSNISTEQYTETLHDAIWPGGTTNVPVDSVEGAPPSFVDCV